VTLLDTMRLQVANEVDQINIKLVTKRAGDGPYSIETICPYDLMRLPLLLDQEEGEIDDSRIMCIIYATLNLRTSPRIKIERTD